MAASKLKGGCTLSALSLCLLVFIATCPLYLLFSRFLASGNAYQSMAYSYQMGVSTVSEIVVTTCKALWETFKEEWMPAPTKDDWLEIAEKFQVKWNFPNCIGALDGKHIVIQAPPNSGSHFFNYKGTFSIVLLALVDADYCFRIVDIGAYGRNSDAGIYASSDLGQQLERGTLNVPEDRPLPASDKPMPFVLVGDEAFPLKRYMMRPYPGKGLSTEKKIYNYRLSRARRIVENAFGILAQRFRIFHKRIQLDPENVDQIVKATVLLHNFLTRANMEDGAGTGTRNAEGDGLDQSCLREAGQFAGNRPSTEAMLIRDSFNEYFNSPEGQVPWQQEMVLGIR